MFPNLKHEDILEIFSKLPPGLGAAIEKEKVRIGHFVEDFTDKVVVKGAQDWNGGVGEALGIISRRTTYAADETIRLNTKQFKFLEITGPNAGKLSEAELDILALQKGGNGAMEIVETKARKMFVNNSDQAVGLINESLELKAAIVRENKAALTTTRPPKFHFLIVLDNADDI